MAKKLKHIFDELHYQLIRKIAEGGMGMVYEAYERGAGKFRKRVAIKVIREEYSAIEEFRNNFIGEARLVADLIHTNIVQTYHLGQIGEQYYMTMEFVSGLTLADFLEHHNEANIKMPVDIAVFIISRLCRGLAYAHLKRDVDGNPLGIVHRDVNPRNIMIAYAGDVKLTDFGIAKALDLMYNEEGEVIAGKDEYLSPEQARKEITDARADLFAAGIVLAELLLGKNPFTGYDTEHTIDKILHMELPDFRKLLPGVDERLITIMERALQRDKNKRYASASDMLNATELYLYSDGYGPTNEKLANYLIDVFTKHKTSVSKQLDVVNQPEFKMTLK